MAAAKFTKDSREFAMFNAYWHLCQKFWVIENDDGYWESLIAETDKFAKDFSDVPLARQIILAFIELKDNEDKERRKNGTS
jgi:hypothetical protein